MENRFVGYRQRKRPACLALVAAAIATVGLQSSMGQTVRVNLDGTSEGTIFEGLGALSAGASSHSGNVRDWLGLESYPIRQPSGIAELILNRLADFPAALV